MVGDKFKFTYAIVNKDDEIKSMKLSFAANSYEDASKKLKKLVDIVYPAFEARLSAVTVND